MQFGSIGSGAQDHAGKVQWVAGEPSRGLPAWTAAILSATSGAVVVFVGFGVMLWNRFATEACTDELVTSRPTLAWMGGVTVWAACALVIPALVAGSRRKIGWICGGLAALIPVLNVTSGIWNLLAPETHYPSWCPFSF